MEAAEIESDDVGLADSDEFHPNELPLHGQIVGVDGFGECLAMDVSRHIAWLLLITTTDGVVIAVRCVPQTE